MDLEARKYHFIQELFDVDNESVMDVLERVLKREKEALGDVPTTHKKELDRRLESYKSNPGEVMDWGDVKDNW